MNAKMRPFPLVYVFVFLFIKSSFSENTKLKDVLRNNSNRSYNNKTQINYDQDDDVLKSEVMKYLEDCSSLKGNRNQDDGNDRYYGNGQSSDTYKRINQNGDYYKNFKYDDNDRKRNERSSTNDRQNSNNNNNENNRNYGNDDNSYSNGNRNGGSYDNNDDPYSSYGSNSNTNSNNNGRNNDRSDGYNNNYDRNRNNNYGNSNYGSGSNGYSSSSRLNNMYSGDRSNGNNGYMDYGTNDRDNMGRTQSGQTENVYGYNREYMRQNNEGSNGYNNDYYGLGISSYGRRIKRENKNNNNNNNENNRNDNQCASQCVFGYMELLDDDQIPSETQMIKWIQDHISNDDMKRITVLREIRKCFTKMSTTAIDDGCDYSNELAKCLNLDLD